MDSSVKLIEKSLAEGNLIEASSLISTAYDRWDDLDVASQQALKAIEPVYLSLLGQHQGGRHD